MSNQSYSSGGEGQESLFECLLDRPQNLSACPFFFGSLLLLYNLLQSSSRILHGKTEFAEGRVLNDSGAGSWSQIVEGGIDDPLNSAIGPRRVLEPWKLR